MKNLVNMNALAVLADSSLAAQVAQITAFQGTNDELANVLREEAGKQKQANLERSAKEILGLVDNGNSVQTKRAQNIAFYQAEIAKIEAETQATAKAYAYGMETKNFLPYAKSIGMEIPAGTKKELLTIPKEWPAAAAATTAA